MHSAKLMATQNAKPEVKEPLIQQRKYFDSKSWLHKQVLPHLTDMVPDDQASAVAQRMQKLLQRSPEVRFLEQLLPLMEDLEEANSELEPKALGRRTL